MHRKFHSLTNSVGCSLKILALLSALALGAGPASAARLEQLADALTTQTVEFFGPPTQHEPAKPVAGRSAHN